MEPRKTTGPGHSNSQYLYCPPYWKHIAFKFFLIFQAVAVVSADVLVYHRVCEDRKKYIFHISKGGKWQVLHYKGQQPLIFVYKKKH